MDKNINKDQDDSDFVNFGMLTNSVGVSYQSNFRIDQNINSINKRNYVKSNQDIISNPSSDLLYSKKNILSKNKNYQEDSINNISSNNKVDAKLNENTNCINNNNTMNSNRQTSKNIFDARIFSDDDMSLNKSDKFINQNANQNLNNNNSSNSLLLSLNINEIQIDDINNNDADINTIKNDIKKIIPNDIFNNLNSSQNHLFTNIKEGLKKLFIYLSDSLNNQKKINGSNDYYYNNDLNSDNLLKIYIFIKSIMNNFKNQNNDIINESLFIINLILPLLPTTFISLICEQLIDIFYYKTAFEELNKNNYLLFKQILRLNQTSFFDKLFLLLKTEKNWDIKYFWKKFICELIQKNNDNYGIAFDINNNENIVNTLNEYHKEELINFCMNIFNYDDLNEISSNKEAVELIKCIYQNKILSEKNNENEISFKEEILNKAKDKEDLYLIIKNIFDEVDSNKNKNEFVNENSMKEKKVPRSKIKRMNIDNKTENNEFEKGDYFKGSFGDFLNNNKSNKYLNDKKENNKEANIENNNNCGNDNEYEDNNIFEVMNNNIILNENNNNININNKKKNGKKKRKIFEIDLTEDDDDNCFENKDSNNNIEDDKEIKENNNINTINNNLTRDNSNGFSNYNEKYSGESVVNYKYSSSINNDIKSMNEQNEKMPFSFKKSIKSNTDINNENENENNINENKFDETNNNRATINNNNNIFSSFSSFSSFKTTQKISKNENINIKENNDLNNENILDNKNNQKDKIIDNNFINEINSNSNKGKKNIIDNNNFLDLIGNNKYKNEEIMDNNNFLNIIKNKLNINNENCENKNRNNANENIIDNNNILNLINNQKTNEDKNNIKINSNKKGNKFNNSSTKKKFEEENIFDFNKCINIIEKEKWSEKQSQINLLKQFLDKNLSKQNYNNSNIPIDSIINLINTKLKDKQQKLVILILEILEIIIIKLEDIFNDVYLSVLSKTIINNLNDNNIQLRYKTATVILKILSYNKKEFFVTELIESLKIDKNNMRIELLTILNQYFSQNKSNNSKKVNKNFFSLLVEPLILCIEDKFNKIRNLSEELIKESTNYISVEKYYEATKKLCGKVTEEKVNCRINEIFCIDKNLNINTNDSTIKSNKSNNKVDMSKIPSTVDNANINKNKRILNLGKKDKNDNLERSKSVDENKNKNIKKKNNNIYKKNIPPKNNMNTIIDTNNTNSKPFVDYKNVFKKNINFSENKKYRNNKDIKLGKNFITIKEKGKLSNTNSINDIKPLTQIFVNEYINSSIIPFNKNLKQILNNLNKVIINIDINFKFEFLSNLDIILEYIIRLFDFNINIIGNLEWIDEYISFIDILYEKLIVNNLKMSPLETGLVLHSLIFLSKYKKEVVLYIKKFYILISIDKTFKILFDYNDLNDIEIQKNILDLFKKEFLQGNINVMNDNFNNLKKIIKYFYKEELAQYAKNFFKEIYGIIGDKIFGEFINNLNKQDKDIFLNNIDFNYNIKNNSQNANKNIVKDNIENNKINSKKENQNSNNLINDKNINKNNNPPIVKFNNKKSNITYNNNKINKIKSTFMKKDILDNINEDDNIMPKDNFERNKKLELDLENQKNERKNSNNTNLKIMKNNTENNINFKNKIDENKIEVSNINEIKELLNDLSAYNEQINIDQLDKDNNINNILANKFKLISILKDLFNSLNFNANKEILIESIELILDSLSNEINFFFNVNTMNNKCPKNIMTYVIEIIDIFSIISSKKEIIITLTENILNKLLILFFNYLEIDKEESISDINQDFNLMLKKINKISLNIIQKSNREIIIIVLLRLISNFKEESDIAVLGINCLVKLIKITDFKNINSVKILAELIISLNDEDLLLDISNKKTNELFLKSIKKLLNQMVIGKKYNILKDYQMAVNLCNIQDEKICEWIQKILEHNKL